MKSRKRKLVLLFTLLFTFITIGFLNSHHAEGAVTGTALLDVNKDRTFVPIRFVSEQFGAEVTWNETDRTILIKNNTDIVLLKINDPKVEVNKNLRTIDAPPFIKDSSTYVPLRFVSTILGAEPSWNSKTSIVSIKMNKKIISLSTVPYNGEQSLATSQPQINTGNAAISESKKLVKIGSKTIKANIVSVDLTDPSIDLKVALAKERVGQVEALKDIAKRNEAVVAINGTFFDAYTKITEPYGMLIADGKIVHIGRERTVFSFDSKNNVSFSIMNPEIDGSTNDSDKWPNNWYSYWLNRTPPYNTPANVVIFTPDRGNTIGFNYGKSVIVENGKVKEIVTDKDVTIPKNGFVIHLMGTEVHSLLSRFTKGTPVDYKISAQGVDFATIEGAIGAGPRLITNGNVTVDFDLEGFKEESIRTRSAARSAIGITNDKQLLFVTATATIIDLAEVMKQLGAHQAMNLDGGASSGLYYNGNYITTPGRNISNAILVTKK